MVYLRLLLAAFFEYHILDVVKVQLRFTWWVLLIRGLWNHSFKLVGLVLYNAHFLIFKQLVLM